MKGELDSEYVRNEHRYELLTWPEISEAVAQEKVIVLPVAAIEQHGHHLPIDVDAKLATSVCMGAGAKSPETMLVMPPVSYGYCHHVMDFPGTISIQPSTFVNTLIDIGTSVAYHGFKRIILINGHGSNYHLVDQAGRQINLTTSATCLTMSWWGLAADYWNADVRESGPGGCAHACELETSMYQYLDGENVREDRIDGQLHSFLNIPGGETWTKIDLTLQTGPASIIEWTSATTETGSMGNPELATAEKGELVYNHAVDQLVAMAKWYKGRPDQERVERHAKIPEFELPFRFS